MLLSKGVGVIEKLQEPVLEQPLLKSLNVPVTVAESKAYMPDQQPKYILRYDICWNVNARNDILIRNARPLRRNDPKYWENAP